MKKKYFFAPILFLVFGLCFFGRAENIYAYSYECSDNIDNDGDGKKDYSATAGAGDAQCASATDDHEGDNPTGFFKAHSTYLQKIPTNPALSSRDAGTRAILVERHPKVYVAHTGAMSTDYGGHYNTYYADESSENATVEVQKSTATSPNSNYDYIFSQPAGYKWSLVPLRATDLARENYLKCMDLIDPTTISFEPDNHVHIISQDRTKLWEFYRLRNCSVYTAYNKNEWKTNRVRMYSWKENGVDSQTTANDPLPGDMYCSFSGGYSYGNSSRDNRGKLTSVGNPRPLGALTFEEIRDGTIDHAIDFTWIWGFDPVNGLRSVYPACSDSSYKTLSTTASNNPTPFHPVAGERFQLNLTHAQIDALAVNKGWNQAKKNILYAMADYGIIMAEQSGDNMINLHALQEWDDVNNKWKHTRQEWLDLLGSMDFTGVWENIRLITPLTPPFAGQPQCADGIDNDGDGKIDYPADPGCSSAYSDNAESDSAATYGLNDFISLISNWLKTIVSPADVNKDGIVNTRDLGIMMTNWQ